MDLFWTDLSLMLGRGKSGRITQICTILGGAGRNVKLSVYS